MNSKVVLVVIVLAVGAGGLWFLRPSADEIDRNDSTNNLPPVSREIQNEGDSDSRNENVAINQNPLSNFLNTGEINPQTAVMIAEWNKSHGYEGLNTTLHSYGPLDNDSLVALRDSGDVIAATILARRLRLSLSPDDRNQSVDAHKYAAALGSTFSMVAIGSDSKTSLATSETSTQTVFDSRAEEGAWYVLAMENGDPAGYINFKWLIESYTGDINELMKNICERRSAANEQLRGIRQEFNLSEPEFSLYPGLAGAINAGELPPIPNCK